MKKLILTLMLATFMSVSPVNASVALENPLDCFSIAPPSTTKNIFSNSWGTSDNVCGYVNSKWLKFSSEDTGRQYYCINNFIEIGPNTTYTFTHFNSSFSPISSPNYNNIYTFDENFNLVGGKKDWFSPPYNYTTLENAKYLLYCEYNVFENLPVNLNIQLELGEITSSSELSFVEYTPKSSVVDPEPLPADTTLDSFYSLYVSKIKEVSQYAIENKFLLGTVTLIILFIVLEIILKIFRKGGYR